MFLLKMKIWVYHLILVFSVSGNNGFFIGVFIYCAYFQPTVQTLGNVYVALMPQTTSIMPTANNGYIKTTSINP